MGFTVEANPSQVSLHLIGFEHDDLNLQSVNTISSVIQSRFKDSAGRNALYIESMGSTFEQTEVFLRNVRRYGGLWNANFRELVVRNLGSEAADSNLRIYKMMLAKADGEEIIEQALVPKPLHHFLYQELDLLREKQPFDVRMEGHSQQVLQQICLQEKRVWNLVDAAKSSLLDRAFAEALQYRLKQTLEVRQMFSREREVVQDLRRWIKGYLQSPESAVIIAVFGFNHIVTLPPQLEKALGAKIKITTETNVPEDYPELSIARKIIAHEEVEPVLLARKEFIDLSRLYLRFTYTEAHQLYRYGQNYENITNLLTRIANGMSYEEIEQQCIQNKVFPDFLRGICPAIFSYGVTAQK